MKTCEIRRIHTKGTAENKRHIRVILEDDETVLSVESEGSDYWVYIAKVTEEPNPKVPIVFPTMEDLDEVFQGVRQSLARMLRKVGTTNGGKNA